MFNTSIKTSIKGFNGHLFPIFVQGWDTRIRTSIKGFKGLCPTIRRYPNANKITLFLNIFQPNKKVQLLTGL